jgi:peptide subunit release factor RF-3
LRFANSFAHYAPRFKYSDSTWRNLNKVAERLTTVAVAFQATVQSDKKHRHRGAMVEAF